MPAAERNKSSDQVNSRHSKIANQVERFVASAFVFEAEHIFDRSVLTEYQQVKIGNVCGNALRSQLLGLRFGNEGSCRCNFLCKSIRVHDKPKRLTRDGARLTELKTIFVKGLAVI